MPRYAAFLRGVTPMNAAMPELKRAFEDAGFTDVALVQIGGEREEQEPFLQAAEQKILPALREASA